MRIDRSRVIGIRVWRTSSSVGGTGDGATFGSGRRVLFGSILLLSSEQFVGTLMPYCGRGDFALSGRDVLLSKPDKRRRGYGRPHGGRAAAARSAEGPAVARSRSGTPVSCGAVGTGRAAWP